MNPPIKEPAMTDFDRIFLDASTASEGRKASPNGPDRPNGRPYFEPHGAARLAHALGEEVYAARRTDSDRYAQLGVKAGPINEHAETGKQALGEITEALRGIEALFGPGVMAAITGRCVPNTRHHHETQDRLERILSALHALAEQAADAEQAATTNDREVNRLEHELATAQGAYDTVRAQLKAKAGQAADAEKDQTWVDRYIKTLEAALELAVPAGKFTEIKRRARRNADKAVQQPTESTGSTAGAAGADLHIMDEIVDWRAVIAKATKVAARG